MIETEHRIFTVLWVLCLFVLAAGALGLVGWLTVAAINTVLLIGCCGALWVLT